MARGPARDQRRRAGPRAQGLVTWPCVPALGAGCAPQRNVASRKGRPRRKPRSQASKGLGLMAFLRSSARHILPCPNIPAGGVLGLLLALLAASFLGLSAGAGRAQGADPDPRLIRAADE